MSGWTPPRAWWCKSMNCAATMSAGRAIRFSRRTMYSAMIPPRHVRAAGAGGSAAGERFAGVGRRVHAAGAATVGAGAVGHAVVDVVDRAAAALHAVVAGAVVAHADGRAQVIGGAGVACVGEL